MADDGLPAIDLPRLPASDWLQIFSSQRPWAPVLDGDRSLWVKGPIRDASVLIALTVRGGVLLTERSPSMRQHPSQVAFPGGRIEAQDRNATEAACREAQEEIGLDPRRLRPVGALPPYLTGSAYRVHAVVALLDDALDLHRQLEPDPNEVASVFEVPLAFLLNPRNHRRHYWEAQEGRRAFYSMPWLCDQPDAMRFVRTANHQVDRPVDWPHEFFIWGATAAMLRNFYQLLHAHRDLIPIGC